MLTQVQFLAIAGRVGGPESQPNSSAALSDGLEWSNFHVISLFGKEDDDTARRSEVDTCERHRKSSTELIGTLVTCAVVLLATTIGRVTVKALLGCFQRVRGRELPATFAPFPSWEMYVFMMQYQGLAESAGDAIASRCLGYVIGGVITLVVLGLMLVLLAWVCVHGLSNNRASWSHVSLKEGLAKMREDWNAAKKERKIWTRWQAKYEAVNVWMVRGEWVEEDHEHKKGVVHSVFVNRFGAIFNSFRQGVWWWGLWGMGKVMVIGVVLSNVLAKETNCMIVFVLNTVEWVLFILLHPDGYWMDFFKNTYRCLANISLLGALYAYLDGTLSIGFYTNIFQYLSLASIAPLILSSLFGGLGAVIFWLSKCMAATASVAESANKIAPEEMYGQEASTFEEFKQIKRMSEEVDPTGQGMEAANCVAENAEWELNAEDEGGAGEGPRQDARSGGDGVTEDRSGAELEAKARRESGLESVYTEDLGEREHDFHGPRHQPSGGDHMQTIPGSPEQDPASLSGEIPPPMPGFGTAGAANVPVEGVEFGENGPERNDTLRQP